MACGWHCERASYYRSARRVGGQDRAFRYHSCNELPPGAWGLGPGGQWMAVVWAIRGCG